MDGDYGRPLPDAAHLGDAFSVINGGPGRHFWR